VKHTQTILRKHKKLYNSCSKCLPHGFLDRKDRIIQPINTIFGRYYTCNAALLLKRGERRGIGEDDRVGVERRGEEGRNKKEKSLPMVTLIVSYRIECCKNFQG